MSHRDNYRQWPFLTKEEFELACAYFDQKYVRAKLGPTRKLFKIRSRRTATTGVTYIEILRLLKLPEEDNDLLDALEKLGREDGMEMNDVEMSNEDADGPYVTYEIHLHPTYSMPTLWFTLHDLPMGEPTFDLDSVYRYLVPSEYKSQLRTVGMTGGLSAAPHPLTDVPAFFIHPCQTKEAMENFDCPIDLYLMIWLGLVGGSVGLWVPPEMAQE
ncbi:autophagy-related protein-like protein Atg10 [Bisporella sp. PMI_857]|nr:autophagy-related protein-like protein Atg10 [Bisporella sp. PMI_857]